MTAACSTMTASARAGGWTILRSRSRRVTVVLLCIVVLSIGDLLLTLAHLRTMGMMEANPIAAWLIRSTQSLWLLSAYKALTVGISVSLLYRLRRHAEGEVAAWCGLAILVGLALVWNSYSDQLDSAEHLRLAQSGLYGESWLMLE